MPRTRSRPKTEEKFQNAVLKLVADEGCSALGINAVAQLAGADKVLIYRYFGDFNGLLQLVAESRQWLPTVDELLRALPVGISAPLPLLREISNSLVHHIRSDASTHQLVRWRRTQACPLCLRFTQEWHQLWQDLPQRLSQQAGADQRNQWAQACGLLSLTLEAELCGEPVDRHCLERIAEGLEYSPSLIDTAPTPPIEESLPTNLL
ncbi:TetR/AcrR family transcriptional regulator [Coraliomargarita algicola]|uniref:TetR/AcrR family transcriptional regulator n=1 Tax=Coraliomargarita algicola TaxID=3092156 RepID=A0ABZ0RKU8_9BACT|nr:TetR/AcrR family transcriptional regulator [Coraliomargarita sp. J2-16]WPJ95635.1 TetR/AcrR family transcriptional regulator [Coraliomargarita sp. J2-16]